MRRLAADAWAVFCTAVAVEAAGQMLVTFAPRQGVASQIAKAESRGIERVRDAWTPRVWLASGLLAANGWAVAALLWRRPTVTAPASASA